ncbi:ferrichrome-iron receptor [Methylosinus sp. C49]|uniref:TonB-dependent siderophore receptor n=1 Tax=Methylosinus sp. C49 TaxID=2699395 RepID=UPI0013668B4F|nr:TonB-dependent siderophore receptor [Methylosinus sp. C49]BBU60464.1 ferrichrome-iron receptor [Methylosinus sp. C49]
MFRTQFLRSASVGALTLAILSSPAFGQETLPSIEIGASAGAPDRAAPQAEKGYSRSTTFSATKTSTPLLDTPQSVQIIPREVLQDRQLIDLKEAVQNVSGVQAESTGSPYDAYLIRGFSTGYGSTYRDGLKALGLAGTVDLAFADRIEIVKGPAAMLYGRIEPGGFVNVVTKRPQEEFAASIGTQFGSWGLSRTVADVTGPIDAEKTVLYRLIAAYDRADSWIDFEHRDGGAAAAYFTFRPSRDFEFNLQFEHYHKKATTFGSYSGGTIPVDLRSVGGRALVIPGMNDRPLDLPRNFVSNDPQMWDKFPNLTSRTHYGFDWTYRFAEKWRITNRFQYIDDHDSINKLSNNAYNGATGVIGRGFWHNFVKRDNISTNLDLAGEVLTGPLKHEILAGVDWFRYADVWTGDCCGHPLVPSLNVFTPAYGYFGDVLGAINAYGAANKLGPNSNQNLGFYLQDHISFLDDRVHLLIGGRWDKYQITRAKTFGALGASCYPACTGDPIIPSSEEPKLSPRAGLSFKIDESASVYGSYSRSFGNYSGLTSQGTISPAETGVQWEVGAKKLWLDGRITTTVALFDLRKKNVLQPDPIIPTRSVAVGEVTSRGVEFDIAGQVTDNLSLIASYTFDSVKITNDNNNGNVGKRYYSAAPNVGNLWAKWDTAPGQAEGWELGGGVYAMDKRYGNNANTWFMPAYVKFDAMVSYRTLFDGHKLKFQFNVKNLTDTKYFESSNGGAYAFYGAPRTFMGAISLEY